MDEPLEDWILPFYCLKIFDIKLFNNLLGYNIFFIRLQLPHSDPLQLIPLFSLGEIEDIHLSSALRFALH